MVHRILLVDDDALTLSATEFLLEENGYDVTAVTSGDEALERLRATPDEFSLAILDYRMEAKDGAATARDLLAACPNIYIIIYSGDLSRDAMKHTWDAGASGFIEKGTAPREFLDTVARWCQKHEETLAALSSRQADETVGTLKMVGRSAALKEIARKVERYRVSPQNVLILGETGTGKELVARALHREETGPFFAINCAAYKGSAELLESELFGHERGAFTGADRDKKGVLEMATGGTLFLDEVHHLSLTAQAKLLRVFQERTIRRVGGTREYEVSFRLVAAAKPDLEKLCERGDFLRDFYHRLNVLPIFLPPLRERPEDVEPLVALFCRKFQETTGTKRTFLLRTVRYLERHDWLGNVRELENTVYRLLTDAASDRVGPEELDAKFFRPAREKSSLTYDELRSRQEKEEREHLVGVLSTSKSKLHAAQRLGLSPSTLHSIMKRVGLYQIAE